MLNPERRKDMVRLEIDRSNANLNEAIAISSLGLWNVVANRIYYAAFHAVSALLIHSGIEVNSHKGTSMMFGQHFIQTGFFDKEMGRFYSKLQSLRENADYDNMFQVTPEKGAEYLTLTQDFVKSIISKIKD